MSGRDPAVLSGGNRVLGSEGTGGLVVDYEPSVMHQEIMNPESVRLPCTAFLS